MAVDLNAIEKQLKAIQSQMPSLTQNVKDVVASRNITETPEKPASERIKSSSASDVLSGIGSMLGTSVRKTDDTDYRGTMVDMMNKLTEAQTQYQNLLSNQKTASELYKEFSDQLGISEKTSALSSLNTNIAKTNQMLDELENNINERIGGTLTTESQRQRQYAVESKPITEQLKQYTQAAQLEQADLSTAQDQLSTLLGLAQTEQQKELAQAQSGISSLTSLLPTIASLAEYQSPEEQLTQTIAQQQLLKNLGLGDYAEADKDFSVFGGETGGYYTLDPATGAVKKVSAGTGTTGASDAMYKQWQLAGAEKSPWKTFADFITFKQGGAKSALTGTTTTTSDFSTAAQAYQTLIDDEAALKSVSGKGWISSSPWTWYNLSDTERKTIADIEFLTSNEMLNNYAEAKAKGLTFGALSIPEMNMLANSATKVNSWKVTDSSGKITGYAVDAQTLKDELTRLKNLAEKAGTGSADTAGGASDDGVYQQEDGTYIVSYSGQYFSVGDRQSAINMAKDLGIQ